MAPEPWLRGPIEGVHPIAAHLIYTFQQTREELAHFVAHLPDNVTWQERPGVPTLGFQLRHLTGSIDRLSTYLLGDQLSSVQLMALKKERDPGSPLASLLQDLHQQLDRTEALALGIPATEYLSTRSVGRKLLPTTVAGLIIHLCEHTQRHLGQTVLTAKLLQC